MNIKEIVTENIAASTTGSGSIATADTGIGMLSRQGGSLLSGKYTRDPTPNTPLEYKKAKKHASGSFKNSIGN